MVLSFNNFSCEDIQRHHAMKSATKSPRMDTENVLADDRLAV